MQQPTHDHDDLQQQLDDARTLNASLVELTEELGSQRQLNDHLKQVLLLNMTQQQAYHRLLGSIFVHHKDCMQCRQTMQTILEMIAHNIEQLDTLLPEDERAKVPN